MIREIGVADLATMRKSGDRLLLLDVRQPEEYAAARLPDSLLVPMGELPARLDEVRAATPEGASVVVMCHHGVRSRMAAFYLMNGGFRDVVSLAGGIDAWSREIDPEIPRY